MALPRPNTYLWEGTVVPKIAFVGEAVADETKLALLDVLLDGIEILLLRYLGITYQHRTLCLQTSCSASVATGLSSCDISGLA